jgi:S-adenosylmethionine:tRNA ribosyltransferase-isomerase
MPKDLVANYPASPRDACRLMVLDRASRRIEHRVFGDIVDYMRPGDCLVLNDTRVIPARLFGRRRSGGKVEVFVLEDKNPICEALVRPSRRLKSGERIVLESGDEVEVVGRGGLGMRVRFERPLRDIIREIGHVPLPPYIDREDEETDREVYQTVYARHDGATAAPTAGLHFTKELLQKVESKGVKVFPVTLHTSYGTFAPIKEEVIEEHTMHREHFEYPESTARAVEEARGRGNALFAVGTTSTRVLEHCAREQVTRSPGHQVTTISGYTDLFIYPGFEFRVVDHLITNFHLPKSTLLLLVSAFAGRDLILEAYREAIERRYRFFSYGDAMLII